MVGVEVKVGAVVPVGLSVGILLSIAVAVGAEVGVDVRVGAKSVDISLQATSVDCAFMSFCEGPHAAKARPIKTVMLSTTRL